MQIYSQDNRQSSKIRLFNKMFSTPCWWTNDFLKRFLSSHYFLDLSPRKKNIRQVRLLNFWFDKFHTFWEGHKILRNLPLTFDCMYCSQKLGEDFAKFCGLLRIYKLYHTFAHSKTYKDVLKSLRISALVSKKMSS